MSTSRRCNKSTSINKFVGYVRQNWVETRNKIQEKWDPEEKFITLNYAENKQQKSKLFKGTCKNCGKFVHRSSYFWLNDNNRKKNKNKRKPCFNGECKNVGKRATGRLILVQ